MGLTIDKFTTITTLVKYICLIKSKVFSFFFFSKKSTPTYHHANWTIQEKENISHKLNE